MSKEQQKEMKKMENFEKKYGFAPSSDFEEQGFEYTIPDGFTAEIKNGKVIVKKKGSEDERIRKELISFVNKYYGEETKKEVLAWLEKQKEQKPAEWSEEDEKYLKLAINIVASDLGEDSPTVSLLKSFRSRPKPSDNWKPSKEQMGALKYSLGDGGYWNKDALFELYNDLKKL